MGNIAVLTDSNSGITQQQAKELGVSVLPMPFVMNGSLYFEDISLTQEEFYQKLKDGAEISTSQPAVGDVLERWETLLKDYEEVVHIPMSSGLSASYESADLLAKDFAGRVHVVNNQRISVTQRQSVLDALSLAQAGKTGAEIKDYLEKVKLDSSIYIMVDTLKYLKKGGRVTPAGAAIGTVLQLKPVLQIQGEKLDAYAKVRGTKQARKVMLEAMQKDFSTRFADRGSKASPETMWLQIAYTYDREAALSFRQEAEEAFPGFSIHLDPLSLSVSCHIGPGALAIACSKKIQTNW